MNTTQKRMVYRKGMSVYYHPYGIDAVAEYDENGLLVSIKIHDTFHPKDGERLTNLEMIENLPHSLGMAGGTTKILGTLAPKPHIGFGDLKEQAQKMAVMEDIRKVFFPHRFLMQPTVLNVQADHYELLNMLGFDTLAFVVCNDSTTQEGIDEFFSATVASFELSKELSQFPGRITVIMTSPTGNENVASMRFIYKMLRVMQIETAYKTNGQLEATILTSTEGETLKKSYSYALRHNLGLNQMFLVDTNGNVVRTVGHPKEKLSTECPLCGMELTVGHGATICSNHNCVSRLYIRLSTFLTQLRIPFTPETIIGLTGKCKVRTLSDAIKVAKETKINNFSPAWLKEYVRNCPEKPKTTLLQLLWGLEIPGLSNNDVNTLVDACRGKVGIFTDYLLNKPRAFQTTARLSAEAQNAFVNWAIMPENTAEWKALIELIDVEDVSQDVKDKPHVLAGMNIYLAGDFRYGGKEKVEQLVTAHGGIVQTTVTDKTDVFVVGDRHSNIIGAEMRRAKALRKPMVSEERFFADSGVQL